MEYPAKLAFSHEDSGSGLKMLDVAPALQGVLWGLADAGNRDGEERPGRPRLSAPLPGRFMGAFRNLADRSVCGAHQRKRHTEGKEQMYLHAALPNNFIPGSWQSGGEMFRRAFSAWREGLLFSLRF